LKADIVALLTCHNRRDLTVRCLESFFSQRSSVSKAAVLVDDGSSDGTSEEVRRRFPDVIVVPGTGSLFWGGGMRLASQVAVAKFEARFHLWLNDDVLLSEEALTVLLMAYKRRRTDRGLSLVVGALKDPRTGATSYSGLVRARSLHRLRFRLVDPSGVSQPCETMNGNVVLVPVEAVAALGSIDPHFPHSIGDTDYGLRVVKAGGEVILAPSYVGECSRNPPAGFSETSLPLAARYRDLRSPKGLPFKAWMTYTRRHGGLLWFVYAMRPYLGVLLSTLPVARRRYLRSKGEPPRVS
jgi:GT2 family glycosyltransferase